MEILGIGMPELILIFIILLLVMGPEDMIKAGRTLGRLMRRIVTSEAWQQFRQTSRQVSTLPNKLMKEAGLEEIDQALKREGRMVQEDIQQLEETLAKNLDFDRMAKSIALSESLAQGKAAPATENAPPPEAPPPAAKAEDEQPPPPPPPTGPNKD